MIDFLGYNEKDFPVHALPTDDAILGRVIEEHRERYFVMTEQGVFEAGVTGKIMYTSDSKDAFPAVGDWVLLLWSWQETKTFPLIVWKATSRSFMMVE